MEFIEFNYKLKYDETEHEVHCSRHDKEDEGLDCAKVCEMFLNFMESVGYSEKNIFDYFHE